MPAPAWLTLLLKTNDKGKLPLVMLVMRTAAGSGKLARENLRLARARLDGLLCHGPRAEVPHQRRSALETYGGCPRLTQSFTAQ